MPGACYGERSKTLDKEVSALVDCTLKHGNGAMRQRRAYERAGRLKDVMDLLIEETTQDF